MPQDSSAPPMGGTIFPAASARGIGLHAAPQHFRARVHDPLDLAIQPAEGLQRLLACSRVSRPSVSLGRLGSNGVRGRQGGGVRPGTPRYAALPASSRSPWHEGEHGVGKSRKCMGCRIFPTLRRGSDLRNRGPATRRQPRLDARPAYRPPGGPRRPRASSRKSWGKPTPRPRGTRSPACRTTASASPCPNAGEPLGSKSTRGKFPTVPERSRSCQNVSASLDATASGLSRHPRWPSWEILAKGRFDL